MAVQGGRGAFTNPSHKRRIMWRRSDACSPPGRCPRHTSLPSNRRGFAFRRKFILTTHDRPAPVSAHRRKLLWGVPAGLVSVQGCGGGSAVAAPVTAPAPAAPATPVSPSPSSPSITSVNAWAARPAAATSAGLGILVPDVGVGGSLWISNGVAWVPVSNPLTLVRKFSNAAMDASVGGNADVLLDSHKIPAYVLGPASGLRITAAYSFTGSGAANKAPQVRAYFGVGTYASSATPLLDTRGQFFSQKSFLLNVTLQNRNALAVNQIRPIDYGFGASGNAFGTSAIDFSQDVTIGFGALNNSASVSPDDQQVLDWFSIELMA